MRQDLVIRNMGAEDIDAVAKIYEEVLEPSYISYSELGEGKAKALGELSENAVTIFRGQLQSLMNSTRHGFFVASINRSIVGFAFASLHKADAGHTECWLDDICVSCGWQHQNIGRTLVTKVLEYGIEHDAMYYLLESGIHNASAHHLFESLGFQPLSMVYWRANNVHYVNSEQNS